MAPVDGHSGCGHRVTTEWDRGVVSELDGRGRVLWRAEAGGQLIALVRLPGGGVVASHKCPDGSQAVEELGPGGKTGWRADSGRLPRCVLAPFPLLALGF